MTRSQYGLLTIGLALIAIVSIFAVRETKIVVVKQIPESLICQPFRTQEDEKAQQRELKKIGAKPVMDQMLFRAFKAQSEGKGELIRIADRLCKEHLGSTQGTSATTYYFIDYGDKKVTTR